MSTITKGKSMQRKGPKSATPRTTEKVVAYGRSYNRVPERMRTITTTFAAPIGASVEELISMAHDIGLTRGHAGREGVYRVETESGVWDTEDGTRLLTVGCTRLSDKARFRSWKVIRSTGVAS